MTCQVITGSKGGEVIAGFPLTTQEVLLSLNEGTRELLLGMNQMEEK